jgi:hypothetical protein
VIQVICRIADIVAGKRDLPQDDVRLMDREISRVGAPTPHLRRVNDPLRDIRDLSRFGSPLLLPGVSPASNASRANSPSRVRWKYSSVTESAHREDSKASTNDCQRRASAA